MIDFTSGEEERPRVNLSALIDVAFILVIFIVLTATYRDDRDLTVDLPQSDRVPQQEATGLHVTVHADGRVEILDEMLEPAAVYERLRALSQQHESVVLIADRAASVEAAVAVLADARAAGFASVAIATKERQNP